MKGLFMFIFTVITLLVRSDSVTPVQAVTDPIKLMRWEEVNKVLPKYKKFVVIDLETGKQFRVQRRAGSHHADVQPLSAKDTSIMKHIYNGQWSWKRRAIIVLSEGEKIAASMHGMPHGAGALKNNFPGHFCIHFYGSTTHRTNHMDLSHKLMVYKAAGKLKSYLATADPYEVTNAYLAGIKEQDHVIASLTSHQQVNWQEIFSKVENLNISQMTILPVEDLKNELHVSVPVTIDLHIANVGVKKYRGHIVLIRFSQIDSWKVDSVPFLVETELFKS